MTKHLCAIYTRKSTEEGLDQVFNTLDAQRDACMAYIQSQKHEGWKALPDHYDDGGYSGGNINRPALKRLMADIKAGKLKTIVVYKIDRLTRSLADFAKLVELLDEHDVSFVSVTQQFNTTTSMGRLTLNVLLSFAQFEREVAGERIRDKIAASKKRGMWMGGGVPRGYRVEARRLWVVPEQVPLVHHVFDLYLKLKNVRDVRDALRADEAITDKVTRTGLYTMLKNPIYIGKIHHRGELYDGEHEAIVPLDTWQEVQQILKENRVNRTESYHRPNLLLTGRIYDPEGKKLSPTSSSKKGRRYYYYVSKDAVQGAKSRTTIRISAGEIEGVVLKELNVIYKDISQLAKVVVHKHRVELFVENQEQPHSVEYHRIPFKHHDMAETYKAAQTSALKKEFISGYLWRERVFAGETIRSIANENRLNENAVTQAIMTSFMDPAKAIALLSAQSSYL